MNETLRILDMNCNEIPNTIKNFQGDWTNNFHSFILIFFKTMIYKL